ncbi:hypothetical protein E8E14_009494 [Neopestalotiopsis sp. 37M]|nr:hypothetical protein E8E14_009494 [Neopestalotiopsis sp. 37M]
MRIRQRQAQLLLLLLPATALALSSSTSDLVDDSLSGSAKPKYDIGTKDAPVDGKDGKPHDGPWVDTKVTDSTGSKKELPVVEDIKLDRSTSKSKDSTADPDSVMDDPLHTPPKKGTTGTEGGVSQKDKARLAEEKITGEKAEKIPETPKEAPPLPHSEHEKIVSGKESSSSSSSKDVTSDKSKGSKIDAHLDHYDVSGLEKPEDLPDKLRDSPNPVPHSADKDHLDVSKPSKSTPKKDWKEDGDEAEGIIQPFHSFVLSLAMILVSEIGDKTFLVAALMAMKHDRMLVFSAAYGALVVMTVLSAVLGHAVPTLIPKKFTSLLAAGLFLVFGVRLLREGMAMDPNEGVSAEMQEVEQELQEKEHLASKQGKHRSSISAYDVEGGYGRKSRSQSRFTPPRSPSTSPARSPSPRGGLLGNVGGGLSNLFSLLLSPAWVQTFVMTFLGEWGDRSQIATIAMAAGQDYWWVTLGAMVGHACCTGVAVLGGKAIAGKVSLKMVTVGGAVAFLVFAFIYFIEAFYA